MTNVCDTTWLRFGISRKTSRKRWRLKSVLREVLELHKVWARGHLQRHRRVRGCGPFRERKCAQDAQSSEWEGWVWKEMGWEAGNSAIWGWYRESCPRGNRRLQGEEGHKTQVCNKEVAFGCLSQRLKVTDSSEKEVYFFVNKRSVETGVPTWRGGSTVPSVPRLLSLCWLFLALSSQGCSWLKDGWWSATCPIHVPGRRKEGRKGRQKSYSWLG